MRHIAKPFIKWVGGKGQLLTQLEAALPHELYTEEFSYVEPFVGGGAMLFFMLQKFPNIKRAYINDINRNLTDAYQTIKDEPEELVGRLKQIEKEYFAQRDDEKQREYYIEKRRQYNEEKLSRADKTALLIFLNRTCFNGLYRENARGYFNVPFGRYVNPTICNEEIIFGDSELLNMYDVQIMSGDYQQTANVIERNGLNFFYFDPPYRPLSATSSFNSYVKEAFNDDSQRGLADFCRQLDKYDNVRWMLSNSDCSSKNPEDTFFEDIYRDFCFRRVYASRMVNANANKRGKLTELLITNYAERNDMLLFASERTKPQLKYADAIVLNNRNVGARLYIEKSSRK